MLCCLGRGAGSNPAAKTAQQTDPHATSPSLDRCTVSMDSLFKTKLKEPGLHSKFCFNALTMNAVSCMHGRTSIASPCSPPSQKAPFLTLGGMSSEKSRSPPNNAVLKPYTHQPTCGVRAERLVELRTTNARDSTSRRSKDQLHHKKRPSAATPSPPTSRTSGTANRRKRQSPVRSSKSFLKRSSHSSNHGQHQSQQEDASAKSGSKRPLPQKRQKGCPHRYDPNHSTVRVRNLSNSMPKECVARKRDRLRKLGNSEIAPPVPDCEIPQTTTSSSSSVGEAHSFRINHQHVRPRRQGRVFSRSPDYKPTVDEKSSIGPDHYTIGPHAIFESDQSNSFFSYDSSILHAVVHPLYFQDEGCGRQLSIENEKDMSYVLAGLTVPTFKAGGTLTNEVTLKPDTGFSSFVIGDYYDKDSTTFMKNYCQRVRSQQRGWKRNVPLEKQCRSTFTICIMDDTPLPLTECRIYQTAWNGYLTGDEEPHVVTYGAAHILEWVDQWVDHLGSVSSGDQPFFNIWCRKVGVFLSEVGANDAMECLKKFVSVGEVIEGDFLKLA